MAGAADKTFTRLQFEKYTQFIDRLEDKRVDIPIKHVSNSAAIIDLPEYNLDMVRTGAILCGIAIKRKKVDQKQAMTFKAMISYVKMVSKGTGIGYGHTFVTEKPSRIGTLGVGYADGYSGALSNKGEVGIKGMRAPVVGVICMDQCMLDLSNIEDAKVGDEVTLFGDGSDGAPSLGDVAKLMGRSVPEVMCTLSRRVPRVYIKDGQVVEIVDYLLNV
jgi:alanine racemase